MHFILIKFYLFRLFGASTLVPFFVFAYFEGKKYSWNFKEMLKPTASWGPQEDADGNKIDRARLH